MPGPRDPEVLVTAARMYYEQNLSQDAVARALGTSRSNVSRMLTAAQELGIVEIRIHDPAGRDAELERALVHRFGLEHAIVAARAKDPGSRAIDRVGRLAWQWLRGELHDGTTVALSWGRSLQAMVWAAGETPASVEVVQLVGGLSSVASEISGQELVRELATRLGARYRYLHAPAIFESAAARDLMLAEPSVSEALDAARGADLAVVGIGAVAQGSSAALLRALALDPTELREFAESGAVGDLGGRFFDAQGREVTGAVHDRVLALTLDEVRAIPRVVGLAVGRDKVEGVAAALRGRLVDVLVCDATVARGVLSQGDRATVLSPAAGVPAPVATPVPTSRPALAGNRSAS